MCVGVGILSIITDVVIRDMEWVVTWVVATGSFYISVFVSISYRICGIDILGLNAYILLS